MKYWHAYGGAINTDGSFVTWEGIKDPSSYRKITDDPSNIQHAFDQFLSILGVNTNKPDGLVSFYKVVIWGSDGILKISGANQDGSSYGDSFSQQELLELISDAEFRDFMRLDAAAVVAEPPSAPINLVVDGYSQEIVNLLWTEPIDKGSDPDNLTFVVQYRQSEEPSFATFGEVVQTSADITGLATDTTYVFRVAAKTTVGQSEFTSTVTQRTLPLYPNIMGIMLTANNHPDPVIAESPVVFKQTPGDAGDPALDGDPVSIWAYNGGLIYQDHLSLRPIYRTGVSSGNVTFNAIEFQGGTRLRFIDTSDFTQNIFGNPEDGYEAMVVLRRLHPIPPLDTQDSGLWYLVGEPTPPETNDTDTHYPETNGVLYERFGSDVRRELFPLPIDLTQWHIYQVRGRNNEFKMWLNGNLVVNSASNDLNNAPAANLPTIGVSYYYGPDNDLDETEMYGGYWQAAEIILFRPYAAGLEETEEAATIIRDQNTAALYKFYRQRYDIQ